MSEVQYLLEAEDVDDVYPASIGTYQIIGRLGHGGMGEVFLGDRGGVRVAIKRIHPALAADAEFRERFAREVGLCRRVNSSTCARFIDADLVSPIPWLATEYIAGPDLHEAVSTGGALELSQAAVVALGLAEALRQIHGLGIVHRDLKPSNVILGVDGPRVIDFGIARAFDQTVFTRTGGAIGSPGWMAPEQLRQGILSEATDVFAWGAIVAYAASGKPPFGNSLPETLMHRVMNEQPDLDSVPQPLRGLCERALNKDFAARPSANDLVAELVGATTTMVTESLVTQRIDRTWRFSPDLSTIDSAPTVLRANPVSSCIRCGVPVTNGFTHCAQCMTSSIENEKWSAFTQSFGAAEPTRLKIPTSQIRHRRKVIAACVVLGLVVLGVSAALARRSGPSASPINATSTMAPDPMTLAQESWPAFSANLPTGRPTSIVSVSGTPTVAYALGSGIDDYNKQSEVAIYEFQSEWKKTGFRYLGKYDPTVTYQPACFDLCVNPKGDLVVYGHVDLRFADVTGDDSPELNVENLLNHPTTYLLRKTDNLWSPVIFGDAPIGGGIQNLKILDSTHLQSSGRNCVPDCATGGSFTTDWTWNRDAEKFDVVKVTNSR